MTTPAQVPEAGRRPRKPRSDRDVILCPFTVVIDNREQRPYGFPNLRANSREHNALIEVPILRDTLHTGDYSIRGFEPPRPGLPICDQPTITIERKSKSDLFGSVARRENFEGRLERMSLLTFAAVVVEAEMSEIRSDPPAHSQLNPKSLSRTIMAWQQRYRVIWYFEAGRHIAEAVTFRILERFYTDHSK